ncbi:hypothetical protein BpHYR1_001758 [Brachionus plicatilis]|uniref:Uncharacterized protein n=1 Tax=Brachionus plicatilis TaxID=10195 RepID=A0A3M7SM06_BRAPC|nr:hypothetical protein BpHYR1_001758 [Brachionus plicatilis]
MRIQASSCAKQTSFLRRLHNLPLKKTKSMVGRPRRCPIYVPTASYSPPSPLGFSLMANPSCGTPCRISFGLGQVH